MYIVNTIGPKKENKMSQKKIERKVKNWEKSIGERKRGGLVQQPTSAEYGNRLDGFWERCSTMVPRLVRWVAQKPREDRAAGLLMSERHRRAYSGVVELHAEAQRRFTATTRSSLPGTQYIIPRSPIIIATRQVSPGPHNGPFSLAKPVPTRSYSFLLVRTETRRTCGS